VGELRRECAACCRSRCGRGRKAAKGILVPRKTPRKPVVEGLRRASRGNLREAADFIEGKKEIPPFRVDMQNRVRRRRRATKTIIVDVKGQVIRAPRARGGRGRRPQHLLVGPRPGTGKSMLAKRVPTILPPLGLEEALETTKIHSIAGALPAHQAVVRGRPFRAPHHTISDAGLLGGGDAPDARRGEPGAQRRAVPRRTARIPPQRAGE
jgi:magnesium chelatase family protein